MAFIANSDFILYDGTKFNQIDWDTNWANLATFTSAGNKDSAWSSIGIGTTTLTYKANILCTDNIRAMDIVQTYNTNGSNSVGLLVTNSGIATGASAYGIVSNVTGVGQSNFGISTSVYGATGINYGGSFSGYGGQNAYGIQSLAGGGIVNNFGVDIQNTGAGNVNCGVNMTLSGSASYVYGNKIVIPNTVTCIQSKALEIQQNPVGQDNFAIQGFVQSGTNTNTGISLIIGNFGNPAVAVGCAFTLGGTGSGIGYDANLNTTGTQNWGFRATLSGAGTTNWGVHSTVNGISTTNFGLYADVTGAVNTNYGAQVNVSGGSSQNRGFGCAVSGATSANYGGFIVVSGGATINYGIYSDISGASIDYDLYCVKNTSFVKLPYVTVAPTASADNGSMVVGYVAGTPCIYVRANGAWNQIT